MRPVLKSCYLALLLVGIASATLAQHSFRHIVPPPALRRIAAPRPAPAHLPVAPRIRKIAVSNTSSVSTTNGFSSTTGSNFVLFDGSPINLDQLLDPSPSFGFDFEHLNAVNPDLGIKALIDPITQQRLALAERLLRETPVAPVSFPFFEGQPVIMLEQQPPVVVLQQPPAAASAATEESAAPATQSSAESSLEPLHDVGTFVLVLRDGTKLSAVAFTVQNERLVYITSDGLRRTILASELDKTATERLNDDRGTPVHFSE
ncbi:MAG TPA: hypothetical protein VGR72_11125 [Candidatus Acidoferrales bacterium]|nr:hypothetical protein [Candidatus Acidoferrales bacterium]